MSPESQVTQETLLRVDGLVLRTQANFCTVQTDQDERVQVNFTRRFKTGERTSTTPVVIGDRVTLRLEPSSRESGGVVEALHSRRNELYRLAPGRSGIKDVLAANLDSVVIVQALHLPEFNPAQLDRFLAIAEQAEIPAAVVLNKVDLARTGEAQTVAATYMAIGYPVVISSAKTAEGIGEVRSLIRGLSALIGPSGVGKSSILNRISPGLHLRTAEISESTRKGRHTTVVAELLSVGQGDYVADTPGLRSIGLAELDKYEIAGLFKELQLLIGQCRFPDCLHLSEPGCAVRAALDDGRLSPARYESYKRLMQDVADGFKEDWETGRTSAKFEL